MSNRAVWLLLTALLLGCAAADAASAAAGSTLLERTQAAQKLAVQRFKQRSAAFLQSVQAAEHPLVPAAHSLGLQPTEFIQFLGAVAGMASAGLAAAGGSVKGGRGRGRGRQHFYYGPSDFDDAWWSPPPMGGPDPFLGGYSHHLAPHVNAFGGMPFGGYGAVHHMFTSAGAYPQGMPWWRAHHFASDPSRGGSMRMNYLTPRDSFGWALGGTFPAASPYYFAPPPLRGDWNLPRNPPPPSADDDGGDEEEEED
eukprot:PLAT10318.1.p2 GENE.PLAT10318.1~~PLAT10318.1.p2  ORF type:complete len:262 (-),score=116.60 PLAT10318.1:177-938(-)